MKHELIGTEQLVWDAHSGEWQPAIIKEIVATNNKWDSFATVEFIHSHRWSRGHFLSSMNLHKGCPDYPGIATPRPTTPPPEPPAQPLA